MGFIAEALEPAHGEIAVGVSVVFLCVGLSEEKGEGENEGGFEHWIQLNDSILIMIRIL